MDFSFTSLLSLISELATVAVTSKPEEVHSPLWSSWVPTLGGLLGVIITTLIGYLNNRPKNQHDQFKVFMDESKEFRDEMRVEREGVKAELKEAKAKTESLQFELKACQSRLKNCNDDLDKCQTIVNQLKNNLPSKNSIE